MINLYGLIVFKFTSQNQGGRPSSSRSLQGSGDIGHAHGHNTHSLRISARDHGSSDAGGGLSAEAYRCQHEITIIVSFYLHLY